MNSAHKINDTLQKIIYKLGHRLQQLYVGQTKMNLNKVYLEQLNEYKNQTCMNPNYKHNL